MGSDGRRGCLLTSGLICATGLLIEVLASGPLAGADDCTLGAELKVGSASAYPGEQVEVPVSGKVDCKITGFSLAVGHDNTRLKFIKGQPSPFVTGHAGSDLVFSALDQNADGYSAVFAFFDISYPIEVPPVALPVETVLATLTYQVLSGAARGPTPLLNRHFYYGAPNYISNIFSRESGEIPVHPTLIDGTVTVLPWGPSAVFLRGDANLDHFIDISDPIFMLIHLFWETPGNCPDASDSNDDGQVNIADVVYLLNFLFRDGLPPAPPFPDPGQDVKPDDLDECKTS